MLRIASTNNFIKYILVTGGVISGIGKGIISSSIGTILRAQGFRVTSIKIDPYINIDAGTFSPYEHGEVFVLDDGGEVDLDLGNYERFLDVTLHRENNITTGKIYQYVIDKERRGDYLGKTVQVVPHITDAIQEWVERVACISVDEDKAEPDICIIELGGTVGDIESMPFVEAFRQFQFRVKKDNFCVVHVSLIPQVICVPDVKTLYRVPLLLEENEISKYLASRLNLQLKHDYDRSLMIKWKDLTERSERLLDEVVITIVGKYIDLEDSYASVVKALHHATLFCNKKLILR
ncbi:unnamed protein product, partial [Didymodactylos carnosus]